jgi:transposase
MWRAGIATDEIATHFKVSGRTVINTYKRLGLPARGMGQRPNMTLAQFFEAQLGEMMARQAQIEQLHLTAAEMVDKIGYKWVGAEHVRELQAGGRR